MRRKNLMLSAFVVMMTTLTIACGGDTGTSSTGLAVAGDADGDGALDATIDASAALEKRLLDELAGALPATSEPWMTGGTPEQINGTLSDAFQSGAVTVSGEGSQGKGGAILLLTQTFEQYSDGAYQIDGTLKVTYMIEDLASRRLVVRYQGELKYDGAFVGRARLDMRRIYDGDNAPTLWGTALVVSGDDELDPTTSDNPAN